MTVSSQYQPFGYKPGAAMAPEAIPFQFLDAADIRVTHVAAADEARSDLALNVDYTIAGDGQALTGTITAMAAWPADDVFFVWRATSTLQPVPIPARQPMPSASYERQLDRMAMVGQEQDAKIVDFDQRALLAPPGETGLQLAPAARSIAPYRVIGRDPITGRVSEIDLPKTFRGDPGGTSDLIGTKAQAAQMAIPVNFDLVRLTGGSQDGDGAAGTAWRRRASAPDHPGYFTDLNGAYWEIVGPELPVEAFGAKGDCPDCSGYDPTSQQAAIKAAIAGATNDAQAFQDAFKTAKALGGGIVTYGHGKFYRIGFSPTALHALVMGSNTTLKRVAGGWLEYDPAAIDGTMPAAPSGGFPARRGWPSHGLTCGDPDTGLVSAFVVTSGNIVTDGQGVSDDDYVEGVALIDVDIRCHTRVFWHLLSGSGYRLYGTYFRMMRRGRIAGAFVKGMPNDGINVTGLLDVSIEDSVAELNGYGAIDGTACNGVSAVGMTIVGRPDLSSQNLHIRNITTRYSKDEGVAYAGVKGIFVDGIVSIGDHDRAVEGIGGYQTTQTDATLGQDVNCTVSISNVIQDGRHNVGTGSIAAGTTSLTVSDPFLLSAFVNTPSYQRRYVFIKGAGAGGGDGPFAITPGGVNYSTGEITLDTAATNTVSDVLVYTYSLSGVTHDDSNQIRLSMKTLRLRNLYCYVYGIDAYSTNNGRVSVEDVEIENAYFSLNFAGVSIRAEYFTGNNIRFIGCSAGSNVPAVRLKSDNAVLTSLKMEAGFAYAVQASQLSSANYLIVENADIQGTALSAIRLDYSARCKHIMMSNVTAVGINSGGSSAEGFLVFANAGAAADNIIMQGCFGRFGGRTVAPIAIAGGVALAAGALGRAKFRGNDFFDPKHLSSTSSLRMQVADRSCYSEYIDLDNDLPGRRVVNVGNAAIAAGRWYLGDRAVVDYPAAGGVSKLVCTGAGAFGALYAADGATAVTISGAVAASATVVVSDATNIWANDWLRFADSFNRQVLWVDHATNTLTLASALTAADGGSVAYLVPAFKAAETLAA